MSKIFRILVCFVTALLLTATVQAADITVEGRGNFRDDAVRDALRNAVEQAVGGLVSSETLVKNGELIKDEILLRSQGFVQSFEVLSEQSEGGQVIVKVKAVVDTSPNSALLSKLQQLNLIKTGIRDPRIAVIIPEQHIRAPVPDPAGETAIIRKLVEAGFTRVLDPKQVASIRTNNIAKSITDNPSTAKAFADKFDLDFIIVGEAFSQYVGILENSGIHSCRARVEAKLIKADTGEAIAANGFHAGGADITEFTAAKKALNNAGEQMGDYMVQQLLSYAGKTDKGLKLTVKGVTSFSKIGVLEKELRSVPGIKEVYVRDYQNGLAVIDVDYSGSAKALAAALEKFTDIDLSVTEVSNSAIQAEIKR